MYKKYMAERVDGKVFIISREEAKYNSGDCWLSWEEYHGNLPIGAEVKNMTREEIKNVVEFLMKIQGG